MHKMVIAFVTQGLPFHGDTLKHKGLGGSETAVIYMAREFAKRGHRVAVFCNCDNPGTYDGVDYYSAQDLPKISKVTKWDVFIASRWPEFLTMPTEAGLRVLWLHDTLQEPPRLLNTLFQTDLAILLSDFHIKNYTDGDDKTHVPWLDKIIWKSSNGVDFEMISEIRERTEKVPNKVIFTSRPERGLDYLTTMILPELLKEFPDLKLHYANYSLGNMQVPDSVKRSHAIVEQQQKKYPHNMVNLGHLTKEKLYEEICSAQLCLYPTNFPEISCITAMEMQACGTPIISTDAFALSETVENGVGGWLINSTPEKPEYAAKFTRKALQLLRDPDLQARMSRQGVEFVQERGYIWSDVADSWLNKFEKTMDTRYVDRKEAVIRQMEREHNLVLAAELTGKNLGIPIAPEPTADSIKAAWKAAVPRFQKTLQFMASYGIRPSSLLDYSCGETAFGLTYAEATKSLENIQVVCADDDPDIRRRNEKTRDLRGFENVTFTSAGALDSHGPADCVFLDRVVDRVPDPDALLRDAMARVKPEGHLIFTCGYGPNDDHTRLWNFDQQDFFCMFGQKFTGHIVFHEEEETPHGEKTGHWIVILPKTKDLQVQPPSIDRKRRTTRPYESLAVCMIAKDEEDWITLCLKQFYEVADKIVIAIDSRTSDRTVGLARAIDTQNKIEFRETDFEDFAQMRNASIEGLEEDWILWIDADERLTNASKLRQFLATSVHEGFSLKQCHLMLDVHGTYDVPVRLLRNKPNYRFVGCIHEHCENIDPELVEKNGYDNHIKPSILIPFSELAHYGYLNEPQRRHKCSNRNMELLRKDIEVYGGKRKLTWVLAMRDYNNIAKWACNMKPFSPNSKPHVCFDACVQTFHRHFKDESARYYDTAFPMYQEALMHLGANNIPVTGRSKPPFSIALALNGALGKEARGDVKAQVRWFTDVVEYQEFCRNQHGQLLEKLSLIDDFKPLPTQVEDHYRENLPELLRLGVGAIDATTGVFKG